MKKYSMDYEDGRCPMGYEFVESHTRGGIRIPAFCRKIPVHRFKKDPETKQKEYQEKEMEKSYRNALKTYQESKDRDPRQFGEEEEF